MGEKPGGSLQIRDPVVEGLFYPEDSGELSHNVASLLKESKIPEGKADAIVSPHAGYDYAGAVIASAFKSASDKHPKKIVIIGPKHRDPGDEIILPESHLFKTSLGEIRVHEESVEQLLGCSTKFVRNDVPHLEEHCLEVQLPFIQHLFPDAAIVPILIGKDSESNIRSLASGIGLTFLEELEQVLIILTLNLTQLIDKNKTEQETKTLLSYIKKADFISILADKRKKILSTCGAGVLATVLSLQKPGWKVEVLHTETKSLKDTKEKKAITYGALSFKKVVG